MKDDSSQGNGDQRKKDQDIADFGAGCGRWLFFTVGGQPALGQTPLWSEVDRARQEMGRADLRLSVPEAARLAAMLGVPYVAIGKMTGGTQHGTPTSQHGTPTSPHYTLTYQLYAMPARRPVGGPLTAQGTQAQIMAALPSMAAHLTQLLGVTSQPLPAVGATPGELSQLGATSWGPEANPSLAQEQSIRDLAVRLPLAGLLEMNVSLREDYTELTGAVARLMVQAPDNPLVLGQIAYVEASSLVPYEAPCERLSDRFPRSYALAHVGVWLERVRHDPKREAQLAQRMVAAAPRNPDAWLSQGATLADAAQAIRQGKFTSDISPQEGMRLDTLYTQRLRVVKKATELDPLYGKAWDRLAEAATFQGQQALANGAFWKAQRLADDPASVYEWGLQMFQEKWGGDPATLTKVAGLAAAERYPQVGQTIGVAQALAGARFPTLSQALLTRAEGDTRAEVVRHPESGEAHWNLAAALEAQGKSQEAISEYRLAVARVPGSPGLHDALGRLLYDGGQWDEAMPQFREAIRLAPGDEYAHFQLGWGLKHSGHLDEAVQEFGTVIRLNPFNADPHYGLGVLYEIQGHPKEAVAEYQKAVALHYYHKDANERLLILLDQDNQLDEALATGRRIVEVYPGDGEAWDALADVFLKRQDWDNAFSASTEALQQNAKDAVAHENRGKALLGQGHKDQARLEWEQVLTLDQGSVAALARENLAKHP